jgi:hypothetical protein
MVTITFNNIIYFIFHLVYFNKIGAYSELIY